MRWHWSNDNPRGSGFWDGRAWFHFPRHTIGLEWGFGKHARLCHLHLDLSRHSDHNIVWTISIPRVLALYITLTGRFIWLPVKERTIGISLYDGYLRLSLWEPAHEWSRGQPWWWVMSVNLPDLLLGKTDYRTRDLSLHDGQVIMPEATYPAKIRMFESTWKRPRWPWPQVIIRADIDLPTPIPFPGKGDNGWDMDDDAVSSMTCPAQTPVEAVEAVRRSVLRTRAERG